MKPLLVGAASMLVVGAALYLLVSGVRPSAPADEPAVEAPSSPAREPATAPPRAATSTPAPATRTPAAPPKPATATLVVVTDVPGASVFIDRTFVGTTPLRLTDLAPGRKDLKLTADGYAGIDRTVQLEAGENPMRLHFREVRLNERLGVVHRHGVGSCEGTLMATVDGLAYQTTNQNDAFRLDFSEVETFEVNYLEKNLRVKQRGGRTWNFTDNASASADALFVLHREVEAARKKLADGFTPVR